MLEMKNTMDWVNRQLDISEGKISEFDSIAMKTIQNETHRGKKHKNKRSKVKQ